MKTVSENLTKEIVGLADYVTEGILDRITNDFEGNYVTSDGEDVDSRSLTVNGSSLYRLSCQWIESIVDFITGICQTENTEKEIYQDIFKNFQADNKKVLLEKIEEVIDREYDMDGFYSDFDFTDNSLISENDLMTNSEYKESQEEEEEEDEDEDQE